MPLSSVAAERALSSPAMWPLSPARQHVHGTQGGLAILCQRADWEIVGVPCCFPPPAQPCLWPHCTRPLARTAYPGLFGSWPFLSSWWVSPSLFLWGSLPLPSAGANTDSQAPLPFSWEASRTNEPTRPLTESQRPGRVTMSTKPFVCGPCPAPVATPVTAGLRACSLWGYKVAALTCSLNAAS